MKMLAKAVLTLALGITTAYASADQVWCSGKVSNLWVSSDGTVFVLPSWRGDHIGFCNLSRDVGSISAKTCASWYGLLAIAVSNKADTTIFYPDAPSCSTMPTYGSAPSPYYVMLVN